jgi:hypothetical protein
VLAKEAWAIRPARGRNTKVLAILSRNNEREKKKMVTRKHREQGRIHPLNMLSTTGAAARIKQHQGEHTHHKRWDKHRGPSPPSHTTPIYNNPFLLARINPQLA